MSETQAEQQEQKTLSDDQIVEILKEEGCVFYENSGLQAPAINAEVLEVLFGQDSSQVGNTWLPMATAYLNKVPITDKYGEDYEARSDWLDTFEEKYNDPEIANHYREGNQLRTNAIFSVSGALAAMAKLAQNGEFKGKLAKFSKKYIDLTKDSFFEEDGEKKLRPSRYSLLDNEKKIQFVRQFERDLVEILELFEVVGKILSEEWQWNGQGISDLPSLAKYMLIGNNRKGNPLAPEQERQLLEGILRGATAERVSGAIPLLKAETVYSSISEEKARDLNTIDPGSIFNPPSKERFLRGSLRRGLEKSPLRRGYEAETREDLEEDIILGYAGNKGGLFYTESVMPDAFLSDLRGFVEVKAYMPYELKAWIDHLIRTGELSFSASDEELKAHGGVFHPHASGDLHLGADLLAEIEFIDNLRAGHKEDGELGLDSIVILRFPSDSPDESLKELGLYLHEKAHLQNVIIQKLPFSSEELTTLAIEIFASQKDAIYKGEGKKPFSKRELKEVVKPLIGE